MIVLEGDEKQEHQKLSGETMRVEDSSHRSRKMIESW